MPFSFKEFSDRVELHANDIPIMTCHIREELDIKQAKEMLIYWLESRTKSLKESL